jgi:hypothetical protein
VPVAFPPKLEAIIRTRLGLPRCSPTACETKMYDTEVSEVEKTACHHPRKLNASPRLAPSTLPSSDVIRSLLRYRYDPAFRGERRVPIRTLATFVGLSHETLYQAMRVGTASECTRVKLTRALSDIAEGRLRFRRRGGSGRTFLV